MKNKNQKIVESEMMLRNKINYNLEIEIEPKFKCGEVYVTENGNMSCFCFICQCDYANYLTFSKHVLEDHLALDNLSKFNEYQIRNDMQQVKYLNNNIMDENYLKNENKNAISELNNSYATDLDDCLVEDNYDTEEDSGDCISVENSLIAPELEQFESNTHANNVLAKKTMNILQIKLNTCDICEKVFMGERALENHKNSHNLELIELNTCSKKQINISIKDGLQVVDNNQKYKCVEKHHVNKFVCQMCLKQFSTKTQYDSHNKKCRKAKKCSYCPRVFQKLINLEKHEERHKKIQTCEYCGKLFENQNSRYQQHLRSHTGEKPFVCSICTKAFSILGNLKQHISQCHSEERPYICTWPNCGKGFKENRQRNWHERIHTGEKPYQCEKCGQFFAFQHFLSLHKKQKHLDKENKNDLSQKFINPENNEEGLKKIQICEYCEKIFQNADSKYRQHLRSHTGEKPFVCLICTRAFTILGNLKQHLSQCHSEERQFICTWPNCGKAFKENRQRVWHERIHTGEKPFQCEQCGQKFAFQHKLSLHKKQKHLDKKDRPHKCDQCEKAFVLLGQLREHKYTHTGEKPHQCDICPAKFAKRGGLREHKKLHTGEKKHVCKTCGKAFAQSAGLATHKKSHNFV